MEQTYHDELDMDLCDGCGLEFCECDEEPEPLCRCEMCDPRGPFTCIGGEDD